MAEQIDSRRDAAIGSMAAGAEVPMGAALAGRRRNLLSGSPAYLAVDRPVEPASAIERALAHLRRFEDQLSGPDCQGLEFLADPVVHRTSAGGQVVHLHQHCHGVPIFEAVRTVRFDSAGNLLDIVGDNVRVPFGVELQPELSAGAAAAIAARHATGSWPRGRPSERPARTLAAFPLPSQPTVLKKARIPGVITAHLVLFHRGGELLLAWLNSLTESADGEHNVIVGACSEHAGEILYCCSTRDCALARGRVFLTSPGEGDRQTVPFPRPLADLPPNQNPELPAAFPPDWVSGTQTRGNNVRAHRGNRRPFKGRRVDGVLTFEASPVHGHDQRVLNAFYFCNYLHDFFYLLGFDEREQNFQKVNFTGVAGDDDELIVRSFGSKVAGGGSMRSRRDGRNPEMRLGLIEPLSRPAALDADIVFHEFAHGVTNRIVGGRLNFDPLRHPQSRALAEGYSDYLALTIQNHGRPPEREKTVIGAWLAGDSRGLRQDPYDDSFPAHFGDLGREKTVGGQRREYVDAHQAGEIWCATLMAMNRALARLG